MACKDFLPNIAPLPAPYDFDSYHQLNVALQTYGNVGSNDCVIAARAHHTVRLVWARSLSMVNITDPEAVTEYELEVRAANGGVLVPGAGLDLPTSLDEWQNSGWIYGADPVHDTFKHTVACCSQPYTIEGAQLETQGAVAALSIQQLQVGICTNSGAQVNLILPPDVDPNDDSTFGPGHTWDDTTGSIGKQHVVLLTGYGNESPPVFVGITFGKKQSITWGFLQARSFGIFFVEAGDAT